MSLVILGMEMPKNCESCGVSCELWIMHKLGQRHPDCPLRSLPEKHGRLIDAEEFCADYEALYNLNDITNSGWILFREWLKNQKTIVEAEGDEMTELKTCPFCGGKDGTNGNYVEITVRSTKCGYRGLVECGCGSMMASGLYTTAKDAREAAIEDWNRRAENG